MSKKETILTPRQIEILRLRSQGYKTSEIARKLATSAANVSATEKTARENIERARSTIEFVKMLEAPLSLSFEPESDLNEVVKKIYAAADAKSIWISHSFPSLANLIQKEAGDKIHGRRLVSRLEVAIGKDGSVMVR